MEDVNENGKEVIRLSMEEADLFILKARLAMEGCRRAARFYLVALMVVAVPLFILNFVCLLGGNMSSLGFLGISVFWIGFFAYRAVGSRRAARRFSQILDRLLSSMGSVEISRALGEGDE